MLELYNNFVNEVSYPQKEFKYLMTVQKEPSRCWYRLPFQKFEYMPPILEVNISHSFNFQLKLRGFQNTLLMQIFSMVVE